MPTKKDQNNTVPEFLRQGTTFNTPKPQDNTPPAPQQDQVTPLKTAPYETGKSYTARNTVTNKWNVQNTPSTIQANPIKIPGQTQPKPQPTFTPQQQPQQSTSIRNQPGQIQVGDSTQPIRSTAPQPTGNYQQDGINLVTAQGATKQDQILRDYNNQVADIKLQEDQMASRFTNSKEIMDGYQLVREAYRSGTMDDNQIAQSTGLALDFVKSVKNDTWHKYLQMSGTGEEEKDLTHQYQNQMQQVTKSKERMLYDFDKTKTQIQAKYDRQVEDIKNDLAKRNAMSKKLGALSGQINSSGYLYGIEDQKNRTYKNLERMATQFGRDNDEINIKRTRMLEDFEDNTKELFYTYNRGMDSIRAKGISAMQQIQQQYGVASEYTSKALEQLYNDLEGQHLNVLNNYMKLQSSFNDLREQEIDATMNYESKKLQQQNQQQSMDMQKRNAMQNMLNDPNIPTTTKLAMQAQMYDQTFAQPVLDKLKQPGEQGGQCAFYTNRVAGLDQSQWMGNELETKLSKRNSKDPVVGSVAVFDIGTRTGHVGIVESIDYAKGTMIINESNRKEDGKVGRREVAINDKSVKGFTVPNKIMNPYKEALQQSLNDQQISTHNQQISTHNQQQMSLPEDQRNLADEQGNLQYVMQPTKPLPLAQRKPITAELAQKYIQEGLKIQTEVGKNPNFKETPIKALSSKPKWMDEQSFAKIANNYDEKTLKTAGSIMNGSPLKLTGIKQGAERENVAQALEDMADVAYQNNDTIGIMRASARYENRVGETTSKQISKASTLINQMTNMSEVLKVASESDGTLQPLYGWIRQKNPRDTDAQVMQALIQSTVPNLARSVYGEVGVLTDQDILRYTQTIPNLRQTKDVQKALLGITLVGIRNQMEDTLLIEAGNGSDVSKLINTYETVNQQIQKIEKELGVGASSQTPQRLLDKYNF